MLALRIAARSQPRAARALSALADSLETLAVSRPAPGVVQVELNRPDKSNAMSQVMWAEFASAFGGLVAAEEDARCVLVTGAGRNFTAGLDLQDHVELLAGGGADVDVGRRALQMRGFIAAYQESFNAIERCPVPVVAAIHGACVGGGVDLATACDIRWCSADASFSIKEVEIGMAADVGTLQRMPRVCGNDSLLRELAYTARTFTAAEAREIGLVSRVCTDKGELHAGALELAATIAAKSPVAVVGTKDNLNFARDHSVADGLRYQQAWNMGMLQTADMGVAASAMMSGTEPEFSPLGGGA